MFVKELDRADRVLQSKIHSVHEVELQNQPVNVISSVSFVRRPRRAGHGLDAVRDKRTVQQKTRWNEHGTNANL